MERITSDKVMRKRWKPKIEEKFFQPYEAEDNMTIEELKQYFNFRVCEDPDAWYNFRQYVWGANQKKSQETISEYFAKCGIKESKIEPIAPLDAFHDRL